MVESSACVWRSNSQPSSSSADTQLGDPLCCLRSSISFGRYESEALDWQKWSTFTENRYMEDVKKYSRPGSVAQMKAHFEAHYKKKAAERAAALLEQHNEVYRGNFDQDSMQIENDIAKWKTSYEEVTIHMVTDKVELSRCATPHSGEGRAPENAQFTEAENRMVDRVGFSKCLEEIEDVKASGCIEHIDEREQDLTQLVKFENPLTYDQVDECDQFITTEVTCKGAYREDGKTQNKATGELEAPTSLDKTRSVFSLFKSRGHIGVPKPPAPPKSLGAIQKRPYIKAYSPSIENSEPIQKRQYRNAHSASKENAADVSNRKVVRRSLYMSIDCAPKETKGPLSPTLQRLANSKLVKTLAGKAAQATQGKPLQDTIDIPAHPAVSLQQKKFSSKSHSICTRNVQPPTVPLPFTFRSDERAAKRREFFERLEQNAKAKETEKDKLQENFKVKARKDFKFMSSKVGTCSDSFSSRRAPSDASKVIATLKDNNAPRRLRASCKEVRNDNQSPAYALKSVSNKFTSENACPNIQP
ncbi:hypothetical protein LIER_17996 [Lithospermum erythrorhizon]|uniref:TPX2 C-terminal domain-containing protein n=1 Tax=Lithospermum erythrorhizon TaxID=34254 RepID=A0AAV3QCC9_LITER